MEASVRGVFSAHYEAWSQGRTLPLHQHKAAYALSHCRTAAMGTHVQYCERGHYAREEPNACRSRSCPRCAGLARERWVMSQQEKLLACDHYHVVFTLPHELLGLFSRHRRVMVALMFQCVRETLMTLLRDERHLGAEPGLLMALHTWGRNLSHHPHIHCLVTGGGITPAGRWRSTKTPYLLPVRLVTALYRNKFIALMHQAVEAGELRPDPDQTPAELHVRLAALREKNWHVRLKERYAHGEGVMKYLARYVRGGPITDRRIRHVDTERVSFTYRDHRDGVRKRMTLGAGDFMGRVMWHVPEPYQHLVRFAGLYSNRAGERRARCREQLGQAPRRDRRLLDWQTYLTQTGYRQRAICPVCGDPLAATPRARQDQNSYRKRRARAVSVQQDDEADIACVPSPSSA